MKPNDDFKLGIIKNGKLEPGDEKFMINFDYPDNCLLLFTWFCV